MSKNRKWNLKQGKNIYRVCFLYIKLCQGEKSVNGIHSSLIEMLIADPRFFEFKNLLEEAAYQQNIVLQTSQALNVAESSTEDKRGSPEVIEGECIYQQLPMGNMTNSNLSYRNIWLKL